LPDRLRALHAAGDRSPDLLEVLCQVANEQKRPEEFLGYLKDLLALHPDDKELQQALLGELLEQGRDAEALAHIAQHGPPRDLEGTAAHGDLLVKAGRLDEAVEVAKRLATMEGIPFRRSDALLRRVLSENEANLPAVNALAEQAVRLARRDQLSRWLMRSFEIDPSQADVRDRLVEMLEEQGQTQPLEQVLRAAALDRPKDAGVVLRYTGILLANGKNAEALEELEKLGDPVAPTDPDYHCQRATALFEVGQHEGAKAAAEAALKSSLPEERAAAMRDLLRRVEEAQLTAELAERVAMARKQPDNVDLQLDVLARLMDRHVDRAVLHADELARRRPDTRAEIKKIIRRHMAGREQGGYPLLNFLADLQVGDGEFDEALETVLQMASRSLDTFSALRDGTAKILRRSPHHLRTLRTMGEMYHDLGQFTEMIHAYSLYLGNGGEGTERINQAMANAYLALGDFENARKFVVALVGRPLPTEPEDAAEAMREENRQYLLKLIPLGLERGRAPDSAELMKQLEMLAAGRKEVRVLRKQVEEALGEQRLAFLKRELESGKGDRNTLEEIGDLCREAEDFNQAITYYQRAARQAGASRVPVAKLAYCFARKRLFDTAGETMAELTLSLQDDSTELDSLMVWIYRTGEVFEEARFFERALRIFKQLMKVDAGYKDVLERVERLSAK
jgi:tetratricopeptide (TPR) repeat protein